MGSFLLWGFRFSQGLFFWFFCEVVINLTETRQSSIWLSRFLILFTVDSYSFCFPIKLVMYLLPHGDNITAYFLILNTDSLRFYLYSLDFVVTKDCL